MAAWVGILHNQCFGIVFGLGSQREWAKETKDGLFVAKAQETADYIRPY